MSHEIQEQFARRAVRLWTVNASLTWFAALLLAFSGIAWLAWINVIMAAMGTFLALFWRERLRDLKSKKS